MVDSIQINGILGDLNNNSKVVTSLVISKSGMYIAGQPPSGIHLETFITMLCIIMSAAESSISGFKGKLENVFIELDSSRIIIINVGNKGVLIIVTNIKDKYDSLNIQVKEAVEDLITVL